MQGARQPAQDAAETPGDVLRTIATNITAQLLEPGFRGCAFINAASEFEVERQSRETSHGEAPLRDSIGRVFHEGPSNPAPENACEIG
jgi:hypothetical protein